MQFKAFAPAHLHETAEKPPPIKKARIPPFFSKTARRISATFRIAYQPRNGILHKDQQAF